MNISFFARPYFFGNDPQVSKKPYLFRGSSLIRGEQVATYLGAKYNPTNLSENDICIYIKPRSLDNVKDGAFVDVVDGDYLVEHLRKRPKIKVIASLKSGCDFLKEKLKREIILIPQHHCNFEQIKRKRKSITTCGYASPPSQLANIVDNQIRKALKNLGLEFIALHHYYSREDVVNFYQKIDIQILAYFGYFSSHHPFTHPTKIVNAGSFGIPTIANWKFGYEELSGNYIPVKSMDELLSEVEKLKDPIFYQSKADRIMKVAENYHISKIAKKYQQLK